MTIQRDRVLDFIARFPGWDDDDRGGIGHLAASPGVGLKGQHSAQGMTRLPRPLARRRGTPGAPTADGELITCDSNGVADFQLLRRRHYADPAILCAFDLVGLDGHELRGEPIEKREAELARLLVDCRPAIALNRVFGDPGPVLFEHACKLGCAGIVSKRRGSQYAAGRTLDWLKVKNPAAQAVRSGQEVTTAVGQLSTLILRRAPGESNPDDYSVIHRPESRPHIPHAKHRHGVLALDRDRSARVEYGAGQQHRRREDSLPQRLGQEMRRLNIWTIRTRPAVRRERKEACGRWAAILFLFATALSSFLAQNPAGCSSAIMLAHGFSLELIDKLIRASLATA